LVASSHREIGLLPLLKFPFHGDAKLISSSNPPSIFKDSPPRSLPSFCTFPHLERQFVKFLSSISLPSSLCSFPSPLVFLYSADKIFPPPSGPMALPIINFRSVYGASPVSLLFQISFFLMISLPECQEGLTTVQASSVHPPPRRFRSLLLPPLLL